MKRSLMIEMIVYEALSWDGLDTGGVPREEIANDMLKACEKLGMLPPTRYYKGESPLTLEMPFKSNTWEPEDE